jgi:hypothetical protein
MRRSYQELQACVTLVAVMQEAAGQWSREANIASVGNENETFNMLKNQGYHFKHNYGRRPIRYWLLH